MKPSPLYLSLVAVKTIRKEGARSLYKGFVPTWSRIAPWSMIFWLTNEEVRKLIGLDSF